MAKVFLMCQIGDKNSDELSIDEYTRIFKQGNKINRIYPDSKFIIYCSGCSTAVNTAKLISDFCIQGVQIKTSLGNGESATSATLPTIDHRLIGGNSGIENVIENHNDIHTHLILITDYENLHEYNSEIDWKSGTIWSETHGLILAD